MESIAQLIAEFISELGLPIALVVVFVWWQLKREKHLTTLLTERQDKLDTLQGELQRENIDALRRVAHELSEARQQYRETHEMNMLALKQVTEELGKTREHCAAVAGGNYR